MEIEDRLREVKRILVITGAGISKESNIATFRDIDGIWMQYDPEEFATAEALKQNPGKVWSWHDKVRQELVAAKPNTAHTLVAQLDSDYTVLVCTQNIDGLHQQAGSKLVVEIHGNTSRARCERCKHKWMLPNPPLFEEKYYAQFNPPVEMLPHCPQCGTVARPDVVLFNEPYGPELGEIAAYIREGVDLVVVIGTSGGVPTPYYLALDAYRKNRCPIIDINPGDTLNDIYGLFPVILRLREPATKGMELVAGVLETARKRNR